MVILSLIELHLRKVDEIRNLGDPRSNVGVLHKLKRILSALHSSFDGSIAKIMVEDQLPRHPKGTLWQLHRKGLVSAVVGLSAVAAKEIYLCFPHHRKNVKNIMRNQLAILFHQISLCCAKMGLGNGSLDWLETNEEVD